MMRKFIWGLSLVLFAAVSCGKNDGPEKKPENDSISLSKSSISLGADSGEEAVTVSSTGEWKVAVGALDSWITSVDPAYGPSGQTDVRIKYASNDTGKSRSAKLTFTTGNCNVVLSLDQAFRQADPEPELENGFPARWETFSSSEQNTWTSSHTFSSNLGATKGLASMTAESASRTLSFAVSSSAPAVGNLGEDDALVWTVPVKSLAAGSGVDFMLTIAASSNNVPKYWVCEILEGGEWKTSEEDLKTADGIRYSFYVKNFSSYQYTTFIQSFTLGKALKNENLKIRCRAVGSVNAAGGALTPSSSAYIFLPVRPWEPASIQCYEGIAAKDTKKAAILGNSFTYYYATHFMLKEIARSQGHQLRMRVHAKGSQYLEDHLTLEKSKEVYQESGYDFAFLQEQSTRHSNYYLGTNDVAAVLSSTRDLVSKFSGARVWLENTWAYPAEKENVGWNGYGNADAFFFCLQNGTKKLCSETGAELSPIGVAFQKAYASGFRNLWYSDDKHQGRTGAYLKACVNYLMMYPERFDSNVSDCELSTSEASQLRSIAESVVLDGYVIPHLTVGEPEGVAFKAEGGCGYAGVDADIPFSVSTDAKWIEVSQTENKVSWTVLENKDDKSRSAAVIISAYGLELKKISISQEGTDPDAPDSGLGSGIGDITGNDYSGYVK